MASSNSIASTSEVADAQVMESLLRRIADLERKTALGRDSGQVVPGLGTGVVEGAEVKPVGAVDEAIGKLALTDGGEVRCDVGGGVADRGIAVRSSVSSSSSDSGGSYVTARTGRRALEQTVPMTYRGAVMEGIVERTQAFVQEKGADRGKAPVTGFFGTYVRIPLVKGLSAKLSDVCGTSLPKASHEQLALARFTAATVPSAFEHGKRRLRMLSIVGDAFLTLGMAVHMYGTDQEASAMQEMRSKQLSAARLRQAYFELGLPMYVVTSAGIDMSTSRVASESFEAIVGVVGIWCGQQGVMVMMQNLSLF